MVVAAVQPCGHCARWWKGRYYYSADAATPLFLSLSLSLPLLVAHVNAWAQPLKAAVK